MAPLLATIQHLTRTTTTTHQEGNYKNKSTTTKVLISYQRRGKDTHDEFMSGLHSKFGGAQVAEVEVSAVGLSKPDSIYLLSMDI